MHRNYGGDGLPIPGCRGSVFVFFFFVGGGGGGFKAFSFFLMAVERRAGVWVGLSPSVARARPPTVGGLEVFFF